MHLIELLAGIIDRIAVGVLILGMALATTAALRQLWRLGLPLSSQQTGDILRDFRISLGRWLLVALEILIVSDILYSIAHRTLEEIAFLAAVVVIRTMLSYFLDHEIARMEQR